MMPLRGGGGNRICDRQTQIIVTVDADDRTVTQRFCDTADQCAILLGHGIANGIGKVYGACTCFNHGKRNLFEVADVRAGRVFRRELDVVRERAS